MTGKSDRHPGRHASSTPPASAGPTSSSTTAGSSAVGDGLSRRPRARRRRLRRRARPGRPPHPPAPAGQGGGRDDRDRRPGRGARRLHRVRRHAQHRRRPSTRAGVVREVLELGRARLLRRPHVGGHHRRPGRRAARPRWPSWPSSACGSSPTTAPACRTTGSCAGPWSTPPASGVVAGPALRGRRRWPSGGHMHEGAWSSRLGIPGQPAEAEELMVMRDIALARLTGARVHFQHLSTGRSVALVRGGQGRGRAGHRRGHPAPLHAHRRRAAPAYDPVFKVNPPLRTDADVAAVRAGLADGTIDAIATDHAPHAPEAKEQPVRPGAAGDARPRDRPGPGAHRARPAASREVLALLSWRPAAIAGARATTTAARSRRAARPTSCVIDPTADVDGRPRRAWPAAAATRPTPGARSPGGSATRSCAANRSSIDGEAQR